MKTYIVFVFIFLIALCEAIFIPLPLTLLSIISYSVLFLEGGERVAFISGLLLDVFTGRAWGINSLFFLLVTKVVTSYRKKIVAHALFYLLPFSTVLIMLYNYIFLKKVGIIDTILSLGAGMIIFVAFSFLESRISRGKKLSY